MKIISWVAAPNFLLAGLLGRLDAVVAKQRAEGSIRIRPAGKVIVQHQCCPTAVDEELDAKEPDVLPLIHMQILKAGAPVITIRQTKTITSSTTRSWIKSSSESAAQEAIAARK